jgi:hypothetical protein
MSIERTYERAMEVQQRITALLDQGYNETRIVNVTGFNRHLVRRVAQGKAVFLKLDTDYLTGLPTINDQAAQEIHSGRWPSDEDRTTAEVYAAAEAIREKRPRDPVGSSATGAGMIHASMVRLDGRTSRGVRSKA